MIDKATIKIKAGNGGNGGVYFVKRKAKVFGPPDGGDGGKGGDVYFVASEHENTLSNFRYMKHFEAEDGGNGGVNQRSGEMGKSITLSVPRGTMIYNAETGELVIDMAQTKEPVLMAAGGLGGRGNMRMRRVGAHARRPLSWDDWAKADEGRAGEERTLTLELKLIADIGLVGLPNAGKSTLLSVLTSAKPKIADYPFTTLEPNLGVMQVAGGNLIIADIPGLIEGAAQGKGLGQEFLRHIERTRVLVHLTQSVADYQTIRSELEKYNKELSEKPEIVVLSKIDILTDEEVKVHMKAFKKLGIEPILLSAATHFGLDGLQKALANVIV